VKRKYVRRPMTTQRVITMVTRIRSRNNRNWMSLLKLAVASKPRQAKAILTQITKNDQEITRWMGRL
jgi:hypothetical protein